MGKRETPIVALVFALVVGVFCLVGGAWKALIERGQGEYGISYTPGDEWAYLWVGIAAAILGLAIYLLMRRMHGRAK